LPVACKARSISGEMIETLLTGSPLGGALMAVLIGLLLGFEREHSQRGGEELFAGVRTFSVLSLCGFVAARIGQHDQAYVLPVTLLIVGGLAVAAYLRLSRTQGGTTTEAVAVLTPLLGALVAWGEVQLSASIAVVVTLLLTMKGALHRLAGRVTEEEISATLRFAIVAVIVVPLLPAQAIGPYASLVPRKVGLVVVILSAVSLVGYVAVRLLGERGGLSLAGGIGGLVSSTAVTLSFSGKARRVPDLTPSLSVGIILASTLLYARVLVLVGLFGFGLLGMMGPWLVGLFLVGVGWSAIVFLRTPARRSEGLTLGNPTELGRAVVLGLTFAALVVVVGVAQERLGEQGIWATAVVGGLVDVDAVSVALAQLTTRGLARSETVVQGVLLATAANLVTKSVLVAIVGGWALARRVLPAFGVLAALSLLGLLF
jgi:uncharacterized membrane protein (DUF4010 family)